MTQQRRTQQHQAQQRRAAFLGTTYGPARQRARLSEHPGQSPRWARGTWATVTAWNPGAVQQAPEANIRAGLALLARVLSDGFSPLPAWNGEGEWLEEALLVPGARLRQAAAWGSEFGQAAVVWGTGRRAALVWLDSEKEQPSSVLQVERFWMVEV